MGATAASAAAARDFFGSVTSAAAAEAAFPARGPGTWTVTPAPGTILPGCSSYSLVLESVYADDG